MSTKKKNELISKAVNLLTGKGHSASLESVQEEVEALTAGRETMNPTELFTLWKYAVIRVDLSKKLEELPVEEKLWKDLYVYFEKELIKMVKNSDGTPINLDKMRDLYQLQRSISEQFTMNDFPEYTSKLEENLVKMEGFIDVHLDKSESEYAKRLDALSDAIKESNKAEERLKLAEDMQKLNTIYGEALIDPLRNISEEIASDLYVLERAINRIEDDVVRALLEKWCTLSKRVYLNLVMALNLVTIDYEFNKVFAKSVIEEKGRTDRNNPELKPLLENYMLMTAVFMQKKKETNKLNTEREVILKRLFPATQHTKASKSAPKIKLDFDIQRFFKTLFTMYGVTFVLGFIGLSNTGEPSPLLALLFPIILLFEGGLIPAIIVGFIVYCGWTFWEQRTAYHPSNS
jgi:hypothetical protein